MSIRRGGPGLGVFAVIALYVVATAEITIAAVHLTSASMPGATAERSATDACCCDRSARGCDCGGPDDTCSDTPRSASGVRLLAADGCVSGADRAPQASNAASLQPHIVPPRVVTAPLACESRANRTRHVAPSPGVPSLPEPVPIRGHLS